MAARKAQAGKRPDLIPVGPSVRLVSLPAIASTFGIPEEVVKRFLTNLGVPYERVYGVPYVSLFALESTLFHRLLPAIYGRARGNSDFLAHLQTLAALEYCVVDAKSVKRRLKKIGTEIVNNAAASQPRCTHKDIPEDTGMQWWVARSTNSTRTRSM